MKKILALICVTALAAGHAAGQSAGQGKNTATTVGTITGGTGKLVGIQGTVRSVSAAQPTAGVIETQTEIEYWFAK